MDDSLPVRQIDDVDELVEVRVLVPRPRLAEFYELHSMWLRGETRPPARPTLFALDDGDGPRSWSKGDVGELAADALLVYHKLSKGAKQVIDTLIELPGVAMSGDELASRLGLSSDQLTGTLASVGKRTKAVNRTTPFQYDPGPNGGMYRISPFVAPLFVWAKSNPQAVGEFGDQSALNLAVAFDNARRELKKRRNRLVHRPDEESLSPEDEAYRRGAYEAREFEIALLARWLRDSLGEYLENSVREYRDKREVPMMQTAE